MTFGLLLLGRYPGYPDVCFGADMVCAVTQAGTGGSRPGNSVGTRVPTCSAVGIPTKYVKEVLARLRRRMRKWKLWGKS
eukprot:3448081-Rhodomonas_salina.1